MAALAAAEGEPEFTTPRSTAESSAADGECDGGLWDFGLEENSDYDVEETSAAFC